MSPDPIGYKDQLNLYAYVGNDPVNRTDPNGEFLLQLAAIGGGALLGVAGQLVHDAIHREWSSGSAYLGAAAGGATAGLVASTTGCLSCAGAMGAAVSSAVTQQGETGHIDGVQVVKSAAIGGVLGAVIPGLKVSGATAGRNSWQAVARSSDTKLANGTISTISATTGAKAVGAEIVENSLRTGAEVATTEGTNALGEAVSNAVESVKEGVSGILQSIRQTLTPTVSGCPIGQACAQR